jgi:eukaryotic-like serine/threonine-protein kinase
MTEPVSHGPEEAEVTPPEGPPPPDPSPVEAPSLWDRLRRARVPQLLGVYAGASFGVLQVADIFVDRLGLPDWTFFGLLLLLVAGVPLVVATALVQSGPKSLRTKELFSWRNTSYAGLGAVAALVLAVAAFMGAHALGIGPVGSLVAAGVIDRDEAILIADFQSPTGDELLAGAITEAFRIDFEQSPVVRVVAPGAVRDGLLRMQRPPETPLTPELARELALREGIKAIILGELNRVGGGSIVSVRLVTPDSEEAVVSFRETIGDDSEMISAVDRLSNRLRERIGESLRSIRGSEPLEQVSTSSLPALRRYSQGVRAIEMDRDFSRGISLLEEAIAEDSTFAMAWRKLGVTLSNQGYPEERWREAFTRAYELNDRLTERERYLTRGSYYRSVARDLDRAAAAYQAVLETYPNETTALNNLAVIHVDRGERRQAVELLSRALALDSFTVIYYTNLAHQQMALEDWQGAERTVDGLVRHFPDLLTGMTLRNRLAWIQGRHDAAEEGFRASLDHPRASLGDREENSWGLVALAVFRGRGEEGLGYLEEIEEQRRRQGLDVNEGNHLQFRVYYELSVRGDTARAIRMVDDYLARAPLPDEAAYDGAHLSLAAFFLQAGELERGRRYLDASDRLLGDAALQEQVVVQRNLTRQLLRFLEGDGEGAIREVQRLVRADPESPELRSALARLHDYGGSPDSAAVQYEAYLATPAGRRVQNESMTHPWTLERLGQLHETLGDGEKAREYHLRFADLWADADPELQPRVRRARERAEALRETG